MRDYAKRYSGVVGARQQVAGRRPSGGNGGGVLKAVGVVAVIALFVGVAGSVWYGLALRGSLAELAKGRQSQQELEKKNSMLVEQRNSLLEQEKIEEAARSLGLYPPTGKQIRRP